MGGGGVISSEYSNENEINPFSIFSAAVYITHALSNLPGQEWGEMNSWDRKKIFAVLNNYSSVCIPFGMFLVIITNLHIHTLDKR